MHKYLLIDPLKPSSSAFQLICGTDIENKEAVQVLHTRVFIDVRSKEISMSGVAPSIPTQIQIVPIFSGNTSEVLPLGLGTLPNATTHSTFQLMGSPDALISKE